MTIRHLTVKERILLHLFDYTRYRDEYEAPVQVTQSGITGAVGIRVQHASQYLKRLMQEDLVEEDVRHIERKPRRRKVYFLTPRGRQTAAALRNALLKHSVPFKTRTGTLEEMSLARIHQEERRGTSLLLLLQELEASGSIAEVIEKAEPGLVDFSDEAPTVKEFFGREKELQGVIRGLKNAPMVVVTGIAGIGKSALGAEVCKILRGQRSLFWRRIRPWDTATDLATRFATFMRALGRRRLHAYLSGYGTKELSRVEEAMAADLIEIQTLLVFDDVHVSSDEVEDFLAILLAALRKQEGSSALLLSRTVPDFYSRRDVEVESSVVEIPLGVLDVASGLAILRQGGVAEAQAGDLVRLSGGSPLFLQVLARAGSQQAVARGLNTLEAYIAEEIEPTLDEEERRCLQLASLYEVPVPKSGLLLGGSGGTRVLRALERKGILNQLETGEWIAHDLLRKYFQEGVPVTVREELVDLAIPWLMRKADEAAQSGLPEVAVAFAENAAFIEGDSQRQLSNLEALGDFRRRARDFQGGIRAARRALEQLEAPEDRARIHRKLALSLMPLGRREEARQELEAGLSLLPPGHSNERTWLTLCRGFLAESGEDYDEAWRDLNSAKEAAAAFPEDRWLREWIAELEGRLYLSDPAKRDPSKSFEAFQTSIAAAEERGSTSGMGWGYFHLSKATRELGRVEESLNCLESALEMAEQSGDVQLRLCALDDQGWILVENQGEYEAASDAFEESFSLAKDSQHAWLLLDLYKAFASLFQRQGKYVAAKDSLEYYLTNAEVGPEYGLDSKIDDLTWLVRLCVLADDAEGAQRWLRESRDLLERNPSDSGEHVIAWAEATIDAARGDIESAERNFQRARQFLSSPPPRYSRQTRGEFLLEYARFLAGIGREENARGVLTEAVERLSSESLRPLEAAAQDELQRLQGNKTAHDHE